MAGGRPTQFDTLDEAGALYQAHLDVVSNALLAGEHEVCMDHFALPLLVRTTQTETLFEEYDDLLDDTKQHSTSLQGHGVTDYVRLVKRARRLSDSLIEGWHETYVLRHSIMLVPSYLSHMFLRLEEGVWKVAEAEHALLAKRFPMHEVAPVPRGFGSEWDNAITDARIQHPHAEPLYQAFITVLTDAQNNRDFDTWAGLLSYPMTTHYNAMDYEIAGPAMARPFFDVTSETLQQAKTVMDRTATRAEFISSDRICGYHNTTISRDGTPICGPIKTRMILTLVEGQWKCSSVTNALSNSGIPKSPEEIGLSDTLLTMREIQQRMKK